MERINEVKKDAYLPILVLTAQHDKETCYRALHEGAKDFLTKPFDQTEALIRIRNMLETKFLHKQIA
jgi:putative two-component system response regulator